MPALLTSTSSGPRRSLDLVEEALERSRSVTSSAQRDRAAAELGGRLLGELDVDVADRDLGALPHERGGGRAADAARAARDRDDLAGERAGLSGHGASCRCAARTGCQPVSVSRARRNRIQFAADGDRPPRLPRRRRHARGRRRRPRDRRGPAARRRRVRGAAALRRPAVRARGAPRSGSSRSAENLRLPLDLDAVRGDVARLLAAAAGEPDPGALRIVLTRGGRRLLLTESLPEHAPRDPPRERHVRAGAAARRHQVALLRRQHARDAPRAGAGRRRGAARHAARARAGGADLVDLLGRRRRRPARRR